MRLNDIISYLEQLAPPSLQESYDNSGLQIGLGNPEIKGCLIALDVTEDLLDEAIRRNCNLIITHHPLLFKGVKNFTGKNYVERCVIKALKHNISIYSIHTNLDNIEEGVNAIIGDKLGVVDRKILSPKKSLLQKLVVFVPQNDTQQVSEAMFDAGAGSIGNYDKCSFRSKGQGSFRAREGTNPYVGEKGEFHLEDEDRLEVVVESHKLSKVVSVMKEAHPYEEVAYDVFDLQNSYDKVGSGMIGHFTEPVYTINLLQKIKETFGGTLRYTNIIKDDVSKIAWCGGSGSFLLDQAKAQGADVFLTSDFKYHQFFDAENEIIIVDIGHYENEQFTKQLLFQKLREKFPNFAVLLTETNTNPINYL